MDDYPQAGIVIDPKREEIAVREFRRLGIPIVGVTDTNCDPDYIDYIIPGNDDAIRAIKLFTSRLADACMEGQAKQEESPEEPLEESSGEPSGVETEIAGGQEESETEEPTNDINEDFAEEE